jgi:2-polyprenyl-6-methoxyphenol hydroxylase-like FAD-dependent oxidoreductase
MKPITIIGGGLAGVTLGIGLREQQVPVRIYEAGTYPRHRVCGEFISGRGLEVLRRHDLFPALLKTGARQALTAAFFSSRARLAVFTLPQPALCLSRYDLDALLARRFVETGGELVAGTRLGPKPAQEGHVRATGRALHPTTNGWRWFGLKAHAAGVQLDADLEMHFLPHAYVGLCRLDDHKINVCGLFRNQPGHTSGDWKAQLSGPRDSLLSAKLSPARWQDNTFCAVSGLRYSSSPRRKQGDPECTLGDAHCLIAPVTGNGMSQAFESAELALAPLIGYATSNHSWPETLNTIIAQTHATFRTRWHCGQLLQNTALHPFAARHILPILLRSQTLRTRFFRMTR